MDAMRHEHEDDFRATADELWRAITDPERTRQYWYGASNRSTWTVGARWTSESDDGELFLEGEILEIEAPRRLVQTFHVVHDPEAAAEPPSTLSWEITPTSDGCHLLVVHEGFGPATLEYITGGWEQILAGLKTYLEADTPLEVGALSTRQGSAQP